MRNAAAPKASGQDLRPIVWSIAGTDPTGGAGIQADLQVFRGFGAFGASVITAVLAQHARGVAAVSPMPARLVAAQLASLADDYPPAAVKIGMLARGATVETVARALERTDAPVVCDPVLAASAGRPLLDAAGVRILRSRLLPRVDLLTPNRPEAERLTEYPVRGARGAEAAARRLLDQGARAVLIKGGHARGGWVHDLLLEANQPPCWFSAPRLAARAAHGTGCTLSSALAAARAWGLAWPDAMVVARAYLHRALRRSGPVGRGQHAMFHGGWPDEPEDLPYLAASPGDGRLPRPFPTCPPDRLRLCPRVTDPADVEPLVRAGAALVRLAGGARAAATDVHALRAALAAARRHGAWLFLDDDWETAIRVGAHGAHLDETALTERAVGALQRAGLCLGIHVLGFAGLARAAAWRPSCLAVGPVAADSARPAAPGTVSPEMFARIRRLASVPVSAEGDLSPASAATLRAAGADGIMATPAVAGRGARRGTRLRAWIEAYGAPHPHGGNRR